MDVQPLTLADLIPDEPLSRTSGGRIPSSMDTLNHGATARRVAELVSTSKGHLNVALFGPWGSGKSSFYGLVEDQLDEFDNGVKTILFDAWKNSGPGFQTNFLSAVASEVEGADKDISSRLFKTTSSVNLPFGASIATKAGRKRWWGIVVALFIGLFLVAPTLWTFLLNAMDSEVVFWQLLAANLSGWAGFAASGSVLFVLVSLFLDLSRVTVQESTPSHISQFSRLFNELMSKSKNTRYVIFIDELDRCRPEDVMTTLEGLRTFLGHEQCVFVVAFDREAIAMTIGRNMPNEVPSRPRRPYYSTSGEYLDKIFQFQISLPPQPVHTFRRFALALVKDKGGVWGQMRERDPRLLDRVIRILSPMHVTSPRRTKVLLNDFAMNSRILESSGFDWLARAEEIAALTVLQTEFPAFAADLELEPGLLKFVANQEKPLRESMAGLYRHYAPRGLAELDELVETNVAASAESDESSDHASGDARKTVARQLNDNLHRFLRRLHDMGCQLPMADLILMHSGGNLLSFDDLATYNALLGATDAPRSETLESLASASSSDRALALLYLLEHVEGASPDEAEDFVILAGAVAETLEAAIVAAESDALTSAWEQLISESAGAISRFDASSLSGFGKALAITYSPLKLNRFYELVLLHNDAASAGVFATILAETPKVKIPDVIPYLSRHAADAVRTTPESLRELLLLQDSAEFSPPDTELASMMIEAFTVLEPEEVEAAAATNAAIAAAAEANAAAQSEYAAEVAAASEEWANFMQIGSHLSVEGLVKPWLLAASRSLGETHEWALDSHDELIKSDIARGLNATANDELLAAIASRPLLASSRWAFLLSADASSSTQLLEDALTAIMEVVTDRSISAADRLAASAVALSLSTAATDTPPKSDRFEAISALLVREAWDPTQVNEEVAIAQNYRGLLRALEAPEDAVDDFDATLLLKATDFEANGVEIAGLPAVTRSLSASTTVKLQSLFSDRIDEASESTVLVFVRQILAVQRRAIELGAQVSPLTHAQVSKSFGSAGATMEDLGEWISTIPLQVELLSTSDGNLQKVNPKFWARYAARASSADRSAAWTRLQSLQSGTESLTAVASGGVTQELYAQAAETVISAKTNAPKVAAVGEFRTLPVANRVAAKEAVRIASHLASQGNGLKSDVPFVVQLLLDNASHIPTAEKAAFRKYLGPWLDAGSAHTRKRDIANLRDLGFAPSAPSLRGGLSKLLGGKQNSK